MDDKNKNASKPDSTLGQIRNMEIGEVKTYPAVRASYIRSVSVMYGFEWGKKFEVRTNRKENVVEIKRVS